MTLIISLISNPKEPVLSDGLVGQITEEFPGAGDPVWLSPGAAAEVPLAANGRDARMIETELRERLEGVPLDIAVLPAQGRRKKLLVADMDSTIIGQECIDELAAFAGLKVEVAAITERAMRGELRFEETLRQRVALLKGVPETAIDEILADRITITPGARTLVATMRANGAVTALVSGGFSAFTGPIADRVGFDRDFANVLVVEDGHLSGLSEEPVRGREAKLDALHEIRQENGVDPFATLAVGDGANDLSMIEAAGLGVAYHAKPAVAAAARARIDHGDLTALLYLQGYRDEEFVG